MTHDAPAFALTCTRAGATICSPSTGPVVESCYGDFIDASRPTEQTLSKRVPEGGVFWAAARASGLSTEPRLRCHASAFRDLVRRCLFLD
jgi:hypothetical protein